MNSYAQLGLGDTEWRGYYRNDMGDNLPAVSLGTGLTAAAIACGGKHSCALLSNAQIKCWGECHIALFPSRWPGSTPEGAGRSNLRLERCGVEWKVGL